MTSTDVVPARLPETIRQVVVKADGIEVAQVALPTPGAGEALLKMVVAGICGSDIHAARGRHPFLPLPYRPGHEVVGIVRGLGEDVSGLLMGSRVTVEPTLPCHDCKQCRAGRTNQCERLQFFGCGWSQGGMADYFTVPADRLHLVPDEFSDEQAALIEPLATPVHAVDLVGGVAGKTVAILGAGVIGLMLLRVADAEGAKRIVVSDPLPSKRELAMRLGAAAALDASDPQLVANLRNELGESADIVFDCVATQGTLDQAVELASRAGTVAVVGVPSRPLTIQLPAVQDQQIRVQGCATYVSSDIDKAIGLLGSGLLEVDDFITASLALEEASTAFDLSATNDQLKVLIHS